MIVVKDLVKDFFTIRAVDHANFTVAKGDVLAFIGPNGAGKSTTMRMLTGFLPPTSGDVFIGGKSVLEEPLQIKKMIGNVAENSPLYFDMRVIDFLRFIVELREVDSGESRIKEVMKICAVTEVQNQLIETLSKGYRKRTSMAGAFLHNPPVLILDEPTDGLDPNQKYDVRMMIKSMAQDKAVILSTHLLEEMDEVCNRVIIMAKGKILYDGSSADLKSKSKSGKVDEIFREITLLGVNYA